MSDDDQRSDKSVLPPINQHRGNSISFETKEEGIESCENESDGSISIKLSPRELFSSLDIVKKGAVVETAKIMQYEGGI